MIFAQISDLHLRGDGLPLKGMVDSEAAVKACSDKLNAFEPRPDAVLATGDLANKGEAQDYTELRRLFDGFEMPVYVIPGNHDSRELMREAFGDWGYLPMEGAFLHYAIDDFPIRLIGLDTKMADGDGGEMCPERVRWLDRTLAEGGDKPTLIFMHHAPFRTGIGFMDKLPFAGAKEMEAVVARHPNVEAVVAGHLHRMMTTRWGGTAATVAPSSAFQMSLDLTPGSKSSFVLEPPGIPMHAWEPDMGVVTHMCVIGDFGPRHPFHVG